VDWNNKATITTKPLTNDDSKGLHSIPSRGIAERVVSDRKALITPTARTEVDSKEAAEVTPRGYALKPNNAGEQRTDVGV
jgi:hypothetical protein